MNWKIDHKSKLPLQLNVEELLRCLVNRLECREGAFLQKEVKLANRPGYQGAGSHLPTIPFFMPKP